MSEKIKQLTKCYNFRSFKNQKQFYNRERNALIKHEGDCTAYIKRHTNKFSSDIKKHAKDCKESINSLCEFNAAIRIHNSRS